MRPVAVLCGTLILASAVHGQDFAVGVHGGGIIARQHVPFGTSRELNSRSAGFSGAVLFNDWLAFRFELNLIDKGRGNTPGAPGPEEDAGFAIPSFGNAARFSYFEVPALLQVASPIEFGRARPFVTMGVAYGYELNCRPACDPPDGMVSAGQHGPLHRNTDLGIVTGGGVSWDALPLQVALEIRKTRGTLSLYESNCCRVTNDVFSVALRASMHIKGVVPDYMLFDKGVRRGRSK